VVNPDAPVWPYQQVAALLRDRIRDGELGPRLPSHMQLAQELGVSPMTVQRALKVLKDEGLIYAERGLGTFVTGR
jgi:GntR family transcriptional regulator